MSEANRIYVDSVIRRCQSERGDSARSSGENKHTGRRSSEEMDALLAMKWPQHLITKAIEVSGQNSGVPELLDWLCLNTPESELPAGFAAQMRPKIEVFSSKGRRELQPARNSTVQD